MSITGFMDKPSLMERCSNCNSSFCEKRKDIWKRKRNKNDFFSITIKIVFFLIVIVRNYCTCRCFFVKILTGYQEAINPIVNTAVIIAKMSKIFTFIG